MKTFDINKNFSYEELSNYKKKILLLHGIRKDSVRREPETIKWIDSIDHGTFCDIGANVGVYSLVAAFNKGIKSVHAFEPMFSNFFGLTANVARNNTSKISPFNIALSNNDEIVPFYFNRYKGRSGTDIGSALHSILDKVGYDGKEFNSTFHMDVISCSFSSFYNHFNIPCPDYVKIDVDGKEDLVIDGMSDVIRDIREIMIEIDDINCNLIDKIVSFGFRVHNEWKHSKSSNVLLKNDNKN